MEANSGFFRKRLPLISAGIFLGLGLGGFVVGFRIVSFGRIACFYWVDDATKGQW